MILSFVYLLILALITLAALGVGRPVVRAMIALDECDELSEAIWSVAVGLVLGGALLMLLGFAGLLYPLVIRVSTLIAASAGFVSLGPMWRARRLRMAGWLTIRDEPSIDPTQEPRPWLVGASRWLLAMIAGATLISALAPPVAGDALCYHLELPKRFLLEHALIELPHDDNAVYPLLAEMWFLGGLALGGGTTAQLVHWLCGVLLAGGVHLLGSPIIGRRWSELAAALALLAPGVNNQMTAPLNDLALAMLTTLALAAWWRAVHDERGVGWYLLAGILLGGALGTKHVALLFVASLGIATAWVIVQQAERRATIVRGAAAMIVVAASLAGPWYARAAWYRGDPVYPFMSSKLSSPIDGETRVAANKRQLGRDGLALLAAPWQVTMQPDRVGGRAHQIGPLWLALLPGLVVSRRLRGLGLLLAISGSFALLWFGLRQNTRFLLPVVPLLAVGAVWMLIECRRWPRWPRNVSTVAVMVLVLFSLMIPVRRAIKGLPVAVGAESRETYLRRIEPTYDIARQMQALGSSEMHVLSQEQRAFYLPGRITRESIYRRHTQYDRAIDAAQLSTELRSAGFTHLLLVDADGGDTSYDATLSRLVARVGEASSDAMPECVCETRFVDSTGGERRYRLMRLSE